MEETIGYEALFSPEEWDSLDLADWDGSSGASAGQHRVTVWFPPGEAAGNEERYEIECDVCGDIGAVDTEEEAQAIARLHEAFVATLVEDWSVER